MAELELPMVATWRGRPLDSLTKEELIDAVKILGRMLQEYNSPERSRAYAIGKVEMMKRDNGRR